MFAERGVKAEVNHELLLLITCVLSALHLSAFSDPGTNH
jgi:hypothetical protein